MHAHFHATLEATGWVAVRGWCGLVRIFLERLLESDGSAAADELGVEAAVEQWLRLLLLGGL